MAEEKLFFEIERSDDCGGYQHLYLAIWEGRNVSNSVQLFSISWQADSAKDYWYACQPKISTEYLSRIARSAELIKRIWAGTGVLETWHTLPADVIKRLQKMGAREVTRDSRVPDELCLIEDVPAEGVYSWADCPDGLHDRGISVRALAIDEITAKVEVGKALIERQLWGYVAQWIGAGEPVQMMSYGVRTGDTRSIEEKIAL